MEILAFLGLTPKRLVGLGAVSALTAAGAAAFAASKPPRYDAVATVFVGQALPSNGSSFDLGPLVADFRTIATSRLIREQVADATNTDAADLAVTAARDGDGSSVEIIVTGPDAAVAQDAARVVGAESMRELAGRGVRRSERLLSDRQAAVTESQSKLDELSKAQGFVDPVQTYAALQTELNRLALLVEDPTSQLTPADREALKGRILALTNQLPDMAIRAETFRLARAELTQAEDDARAAGRSLLEAKTLQVEATDSAVVSVYEATAASTLPAMVQAGGAAAVVTGLVGTGLIAAMDTRRRRTEMDRVPAATTRAASPPDPRDLTDAQKRQLREPAAGGATRSPRLGNQAPERTSPLMQARSSDT
ncbi:MAG: hypothetical protein OEY23_16235, partial [Acidimicrobiia bacterium]|nr:hypothetical protein [Acidimicrobiia bacterium]